jgi:hypothetical protein|tara:strand:- start:80 stop:352 length:273 start_codon:yes stop_codon:yes gene_type:complete
MYNFIKEINKDNDAAWFLEEVVVPERETIGNGGNMWIHGNIVVTKDDVRKICNDRIKALVKLLSGSTNLELKYLRDSLKSWKSLLEAINT